LTNENEKNNRLFVFVGEKLEFKELPSEAGSMDAGYKAKYKVIQRVYGDYSNKEIEFIAYSHKGIPEFQDYRHVLLFVSENEGMYYHEKYQYFDVYKTSNNRWASSYKGYEYRKASYNNTSVKPEKIDFVETVAYPIEKQIDTRAYPKYPEPYYKIIGDSAYAIYGNYVEELFKLKKDGVLTARGLF
jgi:hypothetical protein